MRCAAPTDGRHDPPHPRVGPVAVTAPGAPGALGHSLDDQRRFLLDLCTYDGYSKYAKPSDDDIAKLRALLLSDTAPGASAASEQLNALEDWNAVVRSWQAALSKVVSDPEGAITATRTTLEGVCKHICDEREVSYDDGWDLAKLYKAAASAMEIAPDQHSQQVIKQIRF